ncbi:MAG: hypothetical protein QGF69_01460 [Candidatus Marinimicrobia bacterium]|jgi:hypothetical protein|nr:hypothetical protein [Candidatus Neomarinimicrobiota bacterium]|tara:strand:- start:2348 stop:3067 length:720 start_codon:yes stop_codon:yes gene_type:complete
MMKNKIFLVICFFYASCTPPQMPEVVDIMNAVPEVTTPEKTVIIPLKTLPKGWVMNREMLAGWKTSLPEILGIIFDTTTTPEYWDDLITLPSGIELPIKRAKITYQNKTRVTSEVVELLFVNVDNIYSVTNYELSHFEMNAVVKSLELLNTGFPQLTADDVLKHKVLMEYGTPHDFDGAWHRYQDKDSDFAVRVIDDKHLAVQVHSRLVERQIKRAIKNVYSEEGIELKKQQLMEGFDL